MTAIRKAIPKIAVCGTSNASNVTIGLGLAKRLSDTITVIESSKFYECSALADKVKFEPVYIDDPTHLNFAATMKSAKGLLVINSLSDAWIDARNKMDKKPISAWKSVKGVISAFYSTMQSIDNPVISTYRTSAATDIKNPNAPAKFNVVEENKGLSTFEPRFTVVITEKDNTGKYFITKNLHDPSTVGKPYEPEMLAGSLK